MSVSAEIHIGNDTVVTLTGLQNAIDSSYQNSATVTCTIKDGSGSAVSGVTFPVTMDYVAASDGIYRATIDKALAVSEGVTYYVEVTAAEGGVDGFWRIARHATYRD